MDFFVPPLPPSVSTTEEVKPRVIRSQFGDGYAQRVEDGLNVLPSRFEVAWEFLEPGQADSILSFLKQHVARPFQWTPPYESAPRIFTVAGWRRSFPDEVGNLAIAATFTEEFDP